MDLFNQLLHNYWAIKRPLNYLSMLDWLLHSCAAPSYLPIIIRSVQDSLHQAFSSFYIFSHSPQLFSGLLVPTSDPVTEAPPT